LFNMITLINWLLCLRQLVIFLWKLYIDMVWTDLENFLNLMQILYIILEFKTCKKFLKTLWILKKFVQIVPKFENLTRELTFINLIIYVYLSSIKIKQKAFVITWVKEQINILGSQEVTMCIT
jgi:hypothetical protein